MRSLYWLPWFALALPPFVSTFELHRNNSAVLLNGYQWRQGLNWGLPDTFLFPMWGSWGLALIPLLVNLYGFPPIVLAIFTFLHTFPWLLFFHASITDLLFTFGECCKLFCIHTFLPQINQITHKPNGFLHFRSFNASVSRKAVAVIFSFEINMHSPCPGRLNGSCFHFLLRFFWLSCCNKNINLGSRARFPLLGPVGLRGSMALPSPTPRYPSGVVIGCNSCYQKEQLQQTTPATRVCCLLNFPQSFSPSPTTTTTFSPSSDSSCLKQHFPDNPLAAISTCWTFTQQPTGFPQGCCFPGQFAPLMCTRHVQVTFIHLPTFSTGLLRPVPLSWALCQVLIQD